MHLQTTALRAATLFKKKPALFCRLMLAKLNTKRPLPPLPARKSIGNVIFECDLDGYRGTAPMYFGSYAMLVVDAMKRFLKPGDVFIDVGANVGYLSAIAAELVGMRGQVHCFEPVPTYSARLRKLSQLNPQYSITVNSCAAGEIEGPSRIYVTREPGQNTLVPSYKTGQEVVETIEVPVTRLDAYIAARDLGRVALIKIDAEGFELPILKGLQNYFERAKYRPAIICEVAPRAYPLMGRSLHELATFMAKYNYFAHDLIDGATRIDLCAMRQVDDVLFLAAPYEQPEKCQPQSRGVASGAKARRR